MGIYRWGYLFVAIILIISLGCSSDKKADPVAPSGDNAPMASDSGIDHNVIAAGTLEFDFENGVITDIPDRDAALHYNITGVLGNNFKYTLNLANWPQIHVTMRATNPTALQVWDVRIIFTNLFGKEILNPDGYTNLFDPPGGLPINPFIYFAKEYSNQAFPVGPGAYDEEMLELLWDGDSQPWITYVIECSLNENAAEPIKINNISQSGTITPAGGSMVIQCEVHDWQNDISSVKLLANDFYGQDVPMYKFRATKYYVGTLMNTASTTPGIHKVWIKAESPNPDNIALYMPFNVNVPATSDNAPKFTNLPFSSRPSVSKGVFTYLNGGAFDPEGAALNYAWEQISPVTPSGQFTGTGGRFVPYARWDPPQVLSDTLYLFRINVEESTGSMQVSRAVVAVMNELPKAPEITIPPSVYPNPVNENGEAQFGVNAIDPNVPTEPVPFTYFWEQISPMSPQGTWQGTTAGAGQYPIWKAPSVTADTQFTMRVTITKYWVSPQLQTQANVQFMVKNLN